MCVYVTCDETTLSSCAASCRQHAKVSMYLCIYVSFCLPACLPATATVHETPKNPQFMQSERWLQSSLEAVKKLEKFSHTHTQHKLLIFPIAYKHILHEFKTLLSWFTVIHAVA